MATLDLDLVRHALKTAQEHAFSEVELGVEGASFRARFEPGQHQKSKTISASAPPHPALSTEGEIRAVKSPLVGFFHTGPVPLRVGVKLTQGDVIGVVNALGIANDVESQVSGEIIEVLVEDAQPVQFGQVLAKVKG